ncbi:MAG: FAD-dependent oxidoreductase [Burkholderiales bacterium]|nr:MAG: FAD-dependent oxidoreductase [Burkholderiales bacterium]
MSAAVEWLAGETPFSTRFGDVFRSDTGGLAQARLVFLQGCGLPERWRGEQQWRILETGFGLGLNFLATWQAWRSDAQRPRLLHYASIEAWPVAAGDLLRGLSAWPELLPLAQELVGQWHGLLPGIHRLSFDGGRVLLTLCIGDVKPMLRDVRFEADSVYLDGFAPERNPDMWDAHTLQAVARCCRRGTTLASWCVAGDVKAGLRQCGFSVQRAPGLPPKWHRLTGEFNPAWEPRTREPFPGPHTPGRCVVIGAGLAGAAAAASLARRGWEVVVLDQADSPAAGASSLPAGVFAPHVSPDDALLSRLTRCGIRMTMEQAAALLEAGTDWQPSGVLERRLDGSGGLPVEWPEPGLEWTRPDGGDRQRAAGLVPDAHALWHVQAGWIKPASLVRAWLAEPGVEWRGGQAVARIEQDGDLVHVLDTQDRRLASAELVILAAGPGTAALLAHRAAGDAGATNASGLVAAKLQPVRGQVSMGRTAVTADAGFDFPINGHGSFIPRLPTPAGNVWLMGATFHRDDTGLETRDADHAANAAKLETLLPGVAEGLGMALTDGPTHSWTGVRCASPDRLPAVGLFDDALPGVQLCTAMGSRGLSFAALCAEVLAARLHGEPLPTGKKMAGALDARRLT